MRTPLFPGVTFASLISTLLLLVPKPATADILEHWSANQVCTNGFYLSFITRGTIANQFVAYGLQSDWGIILSSSDGKSWGVNLYGNTNNGFSYAVALSRAGNRIFAFGGFGVSAVSSDGISWTTFNFPPALGAAFGSTRYAAVINESFGSQHDIYVSTNAVAWSPMFLNIQFSDIAYGAGLFVAVCNSTDAGHTYTSPNGLSWTRRDLPLTNSLGYPKISFVASRFIISVADRTNLVSSDGLNWAVLPTGIPNRLGKVDYFSPPLGTGLFFAPAQGFLATSIDGTNWWQYSHSPPGYGNSFVTDGSRLWAVGSIQNPTNPFVANSYVYTSHPLVELRATNTPGQLALSGLVGRNYQIQSTDALSNSGTAWTTNFSGPLPSDPYLWSDPTASTVPQRFYRAVLLP